MKKIIIAFVFLFNACFPDRVSAQTSETDSLIHLLSGNLQDTQRVNLLVKIARNLDNVGDTADLGYSKQALALAKKINYKKGIASSNAILGLSEEARSNFVNAIAAHQNAFLVFGEINDTLGQAKALGNLANNEYFIGDYIAAAEHAYQALRFYESQNYYQGIFATHLTLGNVMIEQKAFDATLNQYRDALKISEHFPDQPGIRARALVSIGNVYNLKENNDSAAYYYLEGLSVFEKLKADYEISVVLNNLGTIRQFQKKYVEAKELFLRSLSLRRIMGDSDGVCSNLQNLGSLSNALGKNDSARIFYSHALFLSEIIESKSQRLGCYEGLAIAFAGLKKFDSAYYYLDRYKTLNDSVRGEESINEVNQLKSRYDSEKQQHQLDLIKSQRNAEKAESFRNIVILLAALLGILLLVVILYYRNRNNRIINLQLEQHNAEITLQKKSITDSINYAKKIQDSILPPESQIKRVLPNSFILYEPKDVVSGDFYWLDSRDNFSIFAAVDCTGHGVPGAMMSVVGFNLLNQAVNEMGLTKPSEILHHLDFGVNKLLRQSDGGNSVKDGMDLAVCSYDFSTRKVQYAGVFNPAYIISKGEFIQLKPDKFPIGINADGITDNYTNHEFQLSPGDMIYLFSDGYADQFGGPMGKKYKYNRFRELLLKIHPLSCEEQRLLLKKEFVDWKGGLEQVDDILVIGVRVE